MRKYLLLLMTFILTLGLFVGQAEAKRFGGGKSFGMQRASNSYSRIAQGPQFANRLNQSGGMGRWLGPIAGLITGGLLASLFMGNGVGSGIIMWLMLGLATYFIINYFKNRSRVNLSSQNFQNYQENSPQQKMQSSFAENPFYKPAAINDYPNDFNSDSFLRDAKVQFIRLQAAYDQKNLGDLRQFTAPEVFGEIQMQLNERGDQINHTEVTVLNAELLDVGNDRENLTATVKFYGDIKEEANASANPFKEIWHFQQDPFSKNWLVAGIQQDH